MNILITGGTGFVGSHMIDFILKNDSPNIIIGFFELIIFLDSVFSLSNIFLIVCVLPSKA